MIVDCRLMIEKTEKFGLNLKPATNDEWQGNLL
jgi:hypothetical protein